MPTGSCNLQPLASYPVSGQHLSSVLVLDFDHAGRLDPCFTIHLHWDSLISSNCDLHHPALVGRHKGRLKDSPETELGPSVPCGNSSQLGSSSPSGTGRQMQGRLKDPPPPPRDRTWPFLHFWGLQPPFLLLYKCSFEASNRGFVRTIILTLTMAHCKARKVYDQRQRGQRRLLAWDQLLETGCQRCPATEHAGLSQVG